MNKTEARTELGLNQTALDRLDKRCRELKLIEPKYVRSAKNGRDERTYSQDDIEIMRQHRMGRNVDCSPESSGARLSGLPESQIANRPVNQSMESLQLFTQTIADAVREAVTPLQPADRILKIKELPITRSCAIRAQKDGKLRMFKNHPHLGRGWRCLESDFRKFLKEVE